VPDGFVLWTRLALDPLAPDGHGGMSERASVIWEVAADVGMRSVIARGTKESYKHWAHSVHIEIAGLGPGRPYWYRFTALGELARTAPAPDAKLARMRFRVRCVPAWGRVRLRRTAQLLVGKRYPRPEVSFRCERGPLNRYRGVIAAAARLSLRAWKADIRRRLDRQREACAALRCMKKFAPPADSSCIRGSQDLFADRPISHVPVAVCRSVGIRTRGRTAA